MFLKSHSDIRHDHFLNSTGDMGINKQQRHGVYVNTTVQRVSGTAPDLQKCRKLYASNFFI